MRRVGLDIYKFHERAERLHIDRKGICMIDLNPLRDKDPATYIAYSHVPNAHLLTGTPVMDAWLQAVLQEACQARGWKYKITNVDDYDRPIRPLAQIWGDGWGEVGTGDSPAEALLRCYLEAII